MKVISVINLKGGVGKTSIAHALATGFERYNRHTLAIDLDPQRNLSYAYNALAPHRNSYDLLQRRALQDECILPTQQGDIIPASEELATADNTLTPNSEGIGRLLEVLIEPLKPNYNYIIIDTPPAINALTSNALFASDEVIIVTQADIFSLQGIGQVTRYLATLKRQGLKANVAGILFNRYQGRQNITKALEEVTSKTGEKINIPIFATKIRECIAFKQAPAHKSNIWQVSPRSNACKDIQAFIDELDSKGITE